MRDRALSVTLVALLAAVRVAAAQPVSPAEAAYQRGREALQVGKYAEACAAFEDSQRLAPQPLTQFNIALCDEQLGKLASALALHREIAANDDNPAERAKSAEMASDLEVRVARLRIDVESEPGIEVTINGLRATTLVDIPVDFGIVRVTVRAPGFVEWTGQATAKSEKQRLVMKASLDPDPNAPTGAPPPREIHTTQPTPASPRKAIAVVSLIGGGLAVGGGVLFGVLARGKWQDAKDVCGGTTCDTPEQLARGNALTKAARRRGDVSTVLAIGGAVLLATGVVVWVTSPKHEPLAIAPAATSSSAGIAVLGQF